jgi:ElaB/YqjD/DUF883 family membrane-anchored ribosome-binding protein
MNGRVKHRKSEFTPQPDEIMAMARQDVAAAHERLAEGSARLQSYVAQKPARSLGIALGAGVLLGWLIARR